MKLFNRPFFKNTAFGRTLSGRNKTGQALGVVKDTVLALTPLKKLSEATGHITAPGEVTVKGLHISELNLSEVAIKRIRYITLGAICVAVLMKLITPEQASQLILLLKEGGVLGYLTLGLFAVAHGERYRIVVPKQRPQKRFGQGDVPTGYITRSTDSQGNAFECEDRFGATVQASAHVPYPKGKSDGFRHVDYISAHPERFQIIEENKE